MASLCVFPEICKNWDKTGKAEYVNNLKAVLKSKKDEESLFVTKNPSEDIKRMLYDLIWNVIKGNLKGDQISTCLGEIMALHVEMPTILADLLSVIDVEMQWVDDESQRAYYTHVVMLAQQFVSEKALKERLDFETLKDASLTKPQVNFYTKFIRVKTKLFYKQGKFNLFREESEGYAKLITELNQDFTGNTTVEYLLEALHSLIGCFNLDPNRVLDIILESFESRPEMYSFFVPLIKSYLCNQQTMCEVLGFKFSFYSSKADAHTPESLYTVAALMLQHEIISLEGFYSVLKPKDSDMIERHKKELTEIKNYARKLNVVATTGDKGAENKEEEAETQEIRYHHNQKLGLCEALLKVGDWKNARKIIARLPDFFVTYQPPIAKALCRLIHATIEPVYRKHSGLSKLIKGHKVPPLNSDVAPKPAETFLELRDAAFPMISALGPMLYTDPVLMVKLIRLANAYIAQNKPLKLAPSVGEIDLKDSLHFDFLTVLDEALLPALSLLDCNCCLAEDVWKLVKTYPYNYRFRLYSRWKNEEGMNHPLLIKARADALKRMKYLMKRLSKENVKPSGRHIGKLSHSNPGVLFDYILSQIQAWDNLIGPVVESLKYLSSLSYDILAYCVVEALANPAKDRMKHDGTSISLWLQSLSNFCGAVFKKYTIDLTGLLQYVANQLKADKSLDLLILKEVVQKMAGIEALEEMTNDQLDAMGGGEVLKSEGGYFSQIRNTKKSSQRLKEALLEQDLAIPLCLLMAQQRNCVIYREEEGTHLKLVGKLYDQCQDTLVQFGSFLSTNLSMDDYSKRLPPIGELTVTNFVTPDVAFFLYRPMLSHAINLKYEEIRKQDKSFKMLSTSQRMQRYLEVVDNLMAPIIETMKPVHPPKVWEDISPQFYVTFWSLSMYDLKVPSGSYDKEINKLNGLITQTEENKSLVQSKRKKEIDRWNAVIDKLQEEEKKQKDHCERVMNRLLNEKDTWFLSRSAKNETITQFLQLCVFPRCTFTAVDAIYCARFVHTIHELKTPNFSTLICYDRIFCDITYTVTSCTENEANRYGRFLCALLETVMRWHSRKEIFEKECANYPGFVTKFRVANQPAEGTSDHVDYENYRHVCHKWHYKITKALVICLESGDYVQIRNSLIVLTKILPYYPMISNLGQVIEKRIEKVKQDEKEKRPDLFVVAIGYAGQLKAKKAAMIPEHEFHLKESKDLPKTKPAANGTVDNSDSGNKLSGKERRVSTGGNSTTGKVDIKTTTVVKASTTTTKLATTLPAAGNNGASIKRDSRSTPTGRDLERAKQDKEGDRQRGKEGRDEWDERSYGEKGRDRRDEKDGSKHTVWEEADGSNSPASGASQRRSHDTPDPDRDVKRRKVDVSSVNRKGAGSEEREKDKEKRSKDADTDRDKDMKPPKDKKEKEKKRDRGEDKEGGGGKRKKDEESVKSSSRQNGESELKERHRKEGSSDSKERSRSRERKTEEKKHHRTSSGSSTRAKKSSR